MTGKFLIPVVLLLLAILLLAALLVSRNADMRLLYSANGVHITASDDFGDVVITQTGRKGAIQEVTWHFRDYYESLEIVGVREEPGVGVTVQFADGSTILCQATGTIDYGQKDDLSIE